MTTEEENKFHKITIKLLLLSKYLLPFIKRRKYSTYLHRNNVSIYQLDNLFRTIPVSKDKGQWFDKLSINTQLAYLRKAIK